jgi:uncharacterized protein YegP (UPF0339 family)
MRARASSALVAVISTCHQAPSWKYLNRYVLNPLFEREVDMTYYIYKDQQGQFRWRLTAANYKIIATSGEGYWNRADCRAAIDLVKSSTSAPVVDLA